MTAELALVAVVLGLVLGVPLGLIVLWLGRR